MFVSERPSADNDNEEAVRRQDRCKDPEPVDVPPELATEIEELEGAGGGLNS